MRVSAMLEWDDWMCGWAEEGEAPGGEQSYTLNPGGRRLGADGSVGPGLIAIEVGDRLRIGGIESGGLIEREVALGWCAGGTEGRGPGPQIEVSEDGMGLDLSGWLAHGGDHYERGCLCLGS